MNIDRFVLAFAGTVVLEAIALQTAAEGHAADAVFDASLARLRLLKAIGEL